NYEEFKKIFHSLGLPGCFGLGQGLTGTPVCFDFNLQKARKILESLENKPKRLKLYVAAQGGDDLSRAAQWFQGQWKKHLGLQIDIEITEFALLTRLLKTSPPDIFRRGVPLDRASCLAGLEPFTHGNPDNF